jgi:ribosomal protein L28
MSSSKSPQHNSKSLTKKTFLPPLQKKIFLYLANNDPKTINETVKAIKGHYKSTWNAFNKLQEKNLIKAVCTKNYQGQEYLRYWVSEDGAFIALCEGAKSVALIKRTLATYPDRRDLHYLLDSVCLLGTDAFEIGYFAFISKGKLEQSDVASMLITQIQHGLSTENVIKFIDLLQKYPEQQPKFDSTFKALSDNMRDLGALFGASKKLPDKVSQGVNE